jgi:hypothetical protein
MVNGFTLSAFLPAESFFLDFFVVDMVPPQRMNGRYYQAMLYRTEAERASAADCREFAWANQRRGAVREANRLGDMRSFA